MRTLQYWKRRLLSGVVSRPRGRPRHDARERYLALLATCRELRRQGYGAGADPIWHALNGKVPLRLVRWATKRLKARKRKRLQSHRRRARISMQVHFRDVLWSLDGTHLGREGSKPIEGQIIKDVGTMTHPGVFVGAPANGLNLVSLLEDTRSRRNGLPLVLASDNGPANTSKDVLHYLASHQVMHLKTCPHTPQHNAWVERSNRELKEDAGLGKGVQTRVLNASKLLTEACRRLDENRLRRSRGFRTAEECNAAMPAWYAATTRASFYEAACKAVKAAQVDRDNGHAARRKEREAILRTMEQFGLITRTRGGELLDAKKHEINS